MPVQNHKFTKEEESLIEKLIAERETRLCEKYNGIVDILLQRIAETAGVNKRLEEMVRELSSKVGIVCESLNLEPPKSYEEFVAELPSLQDTESTRDITQELNSSVAELVAEVGTLGIVNGVGGDEVDGVPAPASRALPSLGKQSLMFKCTDNESRGQGLDTRKLRMFTAVYQLQTGSDEPIKIRCTFLRYKVQELGTFMYDFSVCFPDKTEANPDSYYGRVDFLFSFLDAHKQTVFTKACEIEAGSGSCRRSEESPKEHETCEDATGIVDDIFEIEGGKRMLDLLDGDCMQIRELENSKQCFYFRTELELFAEPLEGGASLQAQCGEDEIDSIAASVDLEQICYKTSDLSEEAQIALETWRHAVKEQHDWYSDMEINLELIIFAHDMHFNRLTQQCVRNVKAMPAELFTSGCVDIEPFVEIATDYHLIDLLEWANMIQLSTK